MFNSWGTRGLHCATNITSEWCTGFPEINGSMMCIVFSALASPALWVLVNNFGKKSPSKVTVPQCFTYYKGTRRIRSWVRRQIFCSLAVLSRKCSRKQRIKKIRRLVEVFFDILKDILNIAKSWDDWEIASVWYWKYFPMGTVGPHTENSDS